MEYLPQRVIQIESHINGKDMHGMEYLAQRGLRSAEVMAQEV